MREKKKRGKERSNDKRNHTPSPRRSFVSIEESTKPPLHYNVIKMDSDREKEERGKERLEEGRIKEKRHIHRGIPQQPCHLDLVQWRRHRRSKLYYLPHICRR